MSNGTTKYGRYSRNRVNLPIKSIVFASKISFSIGTIVAQTNPPYAAAGVRIHGFLKEKA